MPTFDLLSEPWLPVLDAGTPLRDNPGASAEVRHVGLREVLLRAHELHGVHAGSPLETIALNRLLLALSVDAYQPDPDPAVWRSLWHAGRFPAPPLDAYTDQHGGRFDLLHPERPFYQRPEPDASQDGKPPAPLAKLFHDRASGNNATLFGHDVDARPQPLSLAAAARALVAAQAAALGGGVSKPFNLSHGPLVGRAQLWIRGRSLHEALLLNAPPHTDARQGATGRDAPVWRREPPAEYRRRPHEGLLDALTWPARRLTLATETADGETVATGVYLTQGDKLEPQALDDPLDATVESRTKGRFPFGLRADRAVWRDASALFATQNSDGSGAPFTFRWAADIAEADDADLAPAIARAFRSHGVDVFGMVNDKAKAELWRHERLPLYLSVLTDTDRQDDVRDALGHAEEQLADKKRGLRRAVRVTADFALSPPAPGDDAYSNADPKASRALARSLAAEPRYWAALEPAFHALLARLADAPDAATRARALARWKRQVFNAALGAFDAATASFDGDARHLRALAEGRARLRPLAPDPADAQPSEAPAVPPNQDPLPDLPLFA